MYKISIDKTLVPYNFNINLSGKLYNLAFNYNTTFDFYTVDLSYNKEVLVKGEKLILNHQLFKEASQDTEGNLNPKFPNEILWTSTKDKTVTRISCDNINSSVFLLVKDRGE